MFLGPTVPSEERAALGLGVKGREIREIAIQLA